MSAVQATLRIRRLGRPKDDVCALVSAGSQETMTVSLVLVLQPDSRIINAVAAAAAAGICNFTPRMCHLRVWLPQNSAWLR